MKVRRLAGHYTEEPLVGAISEHASARLFRFATGVSAKWLYCSRGDVSFGRGKGTGRAIGGAALSGDKVKSRGQEQNAKELKREHQTSSCCLQDYFGRTEAALQSINSIQHLQGSSKVWTDRSFG